MHTVSSQWDKLTFFSCSTLFSPELIDGPLTAPPSLQLKWQSSPTQQQKRITVAFIIFNLCTQLVNQQRKHTAQCRSKLWARGISTFQWFPKTPDSLITGFFNLTSSVFYLFFSSRRTQCAGNIFSSTEANAQEAVIPSWMVELCTRHDCTTSPSMTAALCQCGQSVLVELVSMANEWKPQNSFNFYPKKEQNI